MNGHLDQRRVEHDLHSDVGASVTQRVRDQLRNKKPGVINRALRKVLSLLGHEVAGPARRLDGLGELEARHTLMVPGLLGVEPRLTREDRLRLLLAPAQGDEAVVLERRDRAKSAGGARDFRPWTHTGSSRIVTSVTRTVDTSVIGAWLNANLAVLAELNAARKILTHHLRAAAADTGCLDDLRAMAVELQATVVLVRALPPIPEPTAALELRASLDCFISALGQVMRVDRPGVQDAGAAVRYAVGLVERSAVHYRAATEAMEGAFGP
jgi:hypothetical protein